MRYRIRRFLNFSEAAAREASVEPQQHQLLLALRGLEPQERPTIGTLAERLQIHHNSAVELTRRAVQRGLIERRTSASDRREAVLQITRQGEAVLRRLSVAHREELRVAGVELLRALEVLSVRKKRAHVPAKKKGRTSRDGKKHEIASDRRPGRAR
jgi:DNA-binding MarR family transcriptional regulator